ncbi:MAG: type II secretion system F family protein, partial [Deltaproteobacteria bacterium]|nr:type II secretion system F family protein [Deltaproteobacteria bacterium]
AFMTLVGGAVLFFLLSFIIPTLTGLFANLGASLPWPTRLLLGVSAFLQSYWWAVVLILALLVRQVRRFLKKEANYRRIEAVIFKVPSLGPLVQRLALAQVLRGLAIMTGGGVALTTALTVTAQGLGRSGFAEALRIAAEKVGQGRSLAEGLEASGMFPPVTRRMVAVGEASGTLTEMLARVAKTYEDETDQVLSALTSLVEPIIILVMGLLVGFVVLSVLLPIFDLSVLVG